VKRSRHRKPTGRTGYHAPGGDGVEFHELVFPDSKEEIEDFIVEAAIKAAASSDEVFPALLGPPGRNPENHFDYTIETGSDAEYLELMEVVVLPKKSEGYEDGATRYDPREMADQVWKQIKRKSRKYGARRQALHLLLYATDWRFELSPVVVELLSCLLARRHHVFRTIFFVSPNKTTVDPLFPVKLTEEDCKAIEAKRSIAIRPDPTRGEKHGPNAISLPLARNERPLRRSRRDP